MAHTPKKLAIKWTNDGVLLRDLPGNLDFPLLVKIRSGWRGDSDAEVIGVEEVYRLHCEDFQRRVIAVDESANHWSFPLHMATKVLNPDKQGHDPMYLENLLSQSTKLPSKIQFAPRDDVLMKIEGNSDDNWTPLITGSFKPLEMIRARFFKANKVEKDIINPRVHILPAYLHIRVQVALGFADEDADAWRGFKQNMSRDVENMVNFDMYRGSMDIKMYPSTTIKKTKKKSKVDLYEEIVPRTVSIQTLLNQRRQSKDIVAETLSDRGDSKGQPRYRNTETGEMSIRIQGSNEVNNKKTASNLKDTSKFYETNPDLLSYRSGSDEEMQKSGITTNVSRAGQAGDLSHKKTTPEKIMKEGKSREEPVYAKVNKKKPKRVEQPEVKSDSVGNNGLERDDETVVTNQKNSGHIPSEAAAPSESERNETNDDQYPELYDDEEIYAAVPRRHQKDQQIGRSAKPLAPFITKEKSEVNIFRQKQNIDHCNGGDGTEELRKAQERDEKVLYAVDDDPVNMQERDEKTLNAIIDGRGIAQVRDERVLSPVCNDHVDAQERDDKGLSLRGDRIDGEINESNVDIDRQPKTASCSTTTSLSSPHDTRAEQDINYVQNKDGFEIQKQIGNMESSQNRSSDSKALNKLADGGESTTPRTGGQDCVGPNATDDAKMVERTDGDQNIVVIGRSWTPDDPQRNITYF